jgi:hypothetical protein
MWNIGQKDFSYYATYRAIANTRLEITKQFPIYIELLPIHVGALPRQPAYRFVTYGRQNQTGA